MSPPGWMLKGKGAIYGNSHCGTTAGRGTGLSPGNSGTDVIIQQTPTSLRRRVKETETEVKQEQTDGCLNERHRCINSLLTGSKSHAAGIIMNMRCVITLSPVRILSITCSFGQ